MWRVTPCDVVSCDIMWHSVVSWRHVMWYHVTSCDIVWYHVMPCDIVWYHVTSCDSVVSCDAMWRGIMWHSVVSCDIMWHHVTWYHVISCDIVVSVEVMSFLPCLVAFWDPSLHALDFIIELVVVLVKFILPVYYDHFRALSEHSKVLMSHQEHPPSFLPQAPCKRRIGSS